MNVSKAKKVTQETALSLLPKWYIDILKTYSRIIKYNRFPDFTHVKTFTLAALDFLDPNQKDDLKRLKIKIEDRGTFDGQIYFQVEIYFKLKSLDHFCYFKKSFKTGKNI